MIKGIKYSRIRVLSTVLVGCQKVDKFGWKWSQYKHGLSYYKDGFVLADTVCTSAARNNSVMQPYIAATD